MTDQYTLVLNGRTYRSSGPYDRTYICPHGCGSLVEHPRLHESYHKKLKALEKEIERLKQVKI